MAPDNNQPAHLGESADKPPSAEAADSRRHSVEGIMAAVSDLADGLEQIRTIRAQAAGLGNGAFTLLGVVAEAGEAGTTISAAADKLGVRPQGLSGTVRDLAEAGLLARKIDRSDGRARRLRITTLGRERLADDGGLYSRLVTEVLAQVPHPSIAKLVISRLDLAFRRVLENPGI